MRWMQIMLLLVAACSGRGFSAVQTGAQTTKTWASDSGSTTAEESLQILRPLRSSGRFSDVYLAVDRRDGQQVVVKTLKQRPQYEQVAAREIDILKRLRAVPDVIELKETRTNATTGAISLVFPYLGDDATGFLHSRNQPLSVGEIRRFMHRMLTALSRCHAAGVIHRDIKPKNVLINRKTGELCLIDFGLSEVLLPPEKPMSCKVATRPYKAPELLLGFQRYTPTVDVWASGLILAGLIFRKMPFIKGETNVKQLELVSRLVGSQALRAYCAKYDIQLQQGDEELCLAIGEDRSATPLRSLVSDKNAEWATDDAIDLCEWMLTVDHALRPSCEQCLTHRYFDSVR